MTTAQLQQIDKHLRSDNWLLNRAFIAEMADHYATAITDRMAAGEAFDAALRAVHTSFGGRRGLLAMEESFVAGQMRGAKREFWQLTFSVFRWPQAAVTLLVVLAVGLILSHPVYSTYLAQGGNVAQAIVCAHVVGWLLVAGFRQVRGRATWVRGHHIGAAFTGFGMLLYADYLSNTFFRTDDESILMIYGAAEILLAVLYEVRFTTYCRLQKERSKHVLTQLSAAP
jgi:hypothetical protein